MNISPGASPTTVFPRGFWFSSWTNSSQWGIMTWKSSKSQVAFAMSIKATEQDKKKKNEDGVPVVDWPRRFEGTCSVDARKVRIQKRQTMYRFRGKQRLSGLFVWYFSIKNLWKWNLFYCGNEGWLSGTKKQLWSMRDQYHQWEIFWKVCSQGKQAHRSCGPEGTKPASQAGSGTWKFKSSMW